MRIVRIGTRGSALARWQSDHIAAQLAARTPGLAVAVHEIVSTGDRVTDVPLSHVEGTGFFTTTIEQALLAGEVDIAVHSYKDLPVSATPGLIVAAVPGRAPVEDVLCARDGLRLDQLPAGARVGTCSTRRTAQVLAMRPDVECVALRGNVPGRIAKVADGSLDAVVLARAGVVRLALEAAVTEVFDLDRMLSAPAQGALAVQCRADDREMRALLAPLDDMVVRRAVDAERTLLHVLGGGCSVPVGAIASAAVDYVALTAGVFALDGRRQVRAVAAGDDAHAVGELAARRLIDLGADAILAEFEKTTRLEAAPVTEPVA